MAYATEAFRLKTIATRILTLHSIFVLTSLIETSLGHSWLVLFLVF